MATRQCRRQCNWRVTLGWLALFWLSSLGGAGHASAEPRWTPTNGGLSDQRIQHTATLLPSGQVLVAGGRDVAAGALTSAVMYDPVSGRWPPTAPLRTARYNHTATLLPSGQVLVAGGQDVHGGALASAELYDPTTGRWTPTPVGSMKSPRYNHTATLLPSGQVLVAGGSDSKSPLASAELYDPTTGRWTLTAGALANPRLEHTATLLPSGQVLVVGLGVNASPGAELYDPTTDRWTPAASLHTNRFNHTATLLPSGQVLVAGGDTREMQLASAELYDPTTNRWTLTTGALGTARDSHTATLLPNGQVLVAGGSAGGNPLTSAELYDPTTDRWTPTAQLNRPRINHTATLLPSGQVLVAGYDDNHITELYDPASGRWTPTGSMLHAQENVQATLLLTGQVLVSGVSPGPNAQLYDPASGLWAATGSLAVDRFYHTATLLPSGQVLVAGGGTGDSAGTAELYDPSTGTWTGTGALITQRLTHTATLLPTGQVLAVGGDFGAGSAEIYAPSSGQWMLSRSYFLPHGNGRHTATLLSSGRVLVVGGVGTDDNGVPIAFASADIYDPWTGQWVPTYPLNTARAGHTATLLPSGSVLVAGGFQPDAQGFPVSLPSAELYDPASGLWTAAAPLHTARFYHTATRLPSGRVLVTGGELNGAPTLGSTELYDPLSGQWMQTGSLSTPREVHTATLLPTGQVLAAGGANGPALASAELYDPGLDFQDLWRPSLTTVVSPVVVGAAVGLVGSFFQGLSEASGGNGAQQSASNYPLVQLRRLDNEQTRFLPVDPVAGWSDTSFTSGPLVDFPPGPALATVITNGIPSLAQPVVVTAATLGCPPPGCDSPGANLRLGPVQVSPHRVPLGQSVQVTTAIEAGNTPVFDLLVRFYDGDPAAGGQVFEAERIPHLPAHGTQALHVSFTPAACRTYRLVVVAHEGTLIEDRRASQPLHVQCRD